MSQKQEGLNSLQVILDKVINELKSAGINYNSTSKNLKRAKDAEEILIKSYETGKIIYLIQ